MRSKFRTSFFPQKRLSISVAILAALITGVSVQTVLNMHRLARLTEKLYNHPFTVNTAILRIEAGINEISISTHSLTHTEDPTEIEAIAKNIDKCDEAILKDFDLILDRFLGDITVIESARTSFTEWKPHRDQLIYLYKNGNISWADNITKSITAEESELLSLLQNDIDHVQDFASQQAKDFLAEAQQTEQELIRLTLLFTLLCGIVIAAWLIRMTGLIQQRDKAQTKLVLQKRRAECLLQLPELAESLDEATFLQRGQEMAEDLTGSKIAFIHFVNDGGKSIELVTWSRRTLEHYCTAAYDSHYPVDHAGIWADALRQNKAVVFNDYPNYPHKHGLPEGHAHLQRLISVPVIEDGQVVVITGVGNKATDYTDLDVETVQLISNDIWRFVQRRRTLARLEASEQKLHQAQQLTNLASWEMDHDTREIVWSDGVWKILETSAKAIGNSYEDLRHWVHPEDQAIVHKVFNEAVANSQIYEVTYRLRLDSNKIKHIHERGETTYSNTGEPLRTLGTLQDISDRMSKEVKLRQAAAVFKNTAEGVVLTDLQGKILDVNEAFTKITGYEREYVIGKNPRILKSGRYKREFYKALWQTLLSEGTWQGEIWNRNKDGSVYPELLTISTILDEEEKPTGYVGVFSDITQVKEAEEKLYHLAHHHPLTDLPNRLLLDFRIDQSLSRARRNSSKLAVIFIDLDRFKHINDSMGHPTGDRILQEFANRLQPIFRSSDTVAHLGGDEFVLVLEDVKDSLMITAVLDKVLAALEGSFKLEDREIYVTASLGISLFPDDGETAALLLQNADVAMYRAKAKGGNTYCFYTQEMTAAALEYVVMDNALRAAIAQQQFHLVYQPQIDLMTQEWVGVEALIRWQHPELGRVSPNVFIPVAEQNGAIREIGKWVLWEACTQGKKWLDEGLKFGRVAVNIAGPQLQSGDLPDVIAEVLEETQLPPEALELEITESFIMQHPESQIQQLHILREMGIYLAIDDFGTGYSSMSYLKQLPVDKLKIDRSFVDDIPNDVNDMAITEAVIALGQALNLEIIAEGVETEKQANYLRDRNCGQAQGYLYSKPIDPLTVPEFLTNPPFKRDLDL